MRLGSGIGSTSQDRATWLALLALLLGVLAPAVCVLWFMNEAVRNQDDAARQRISEAYRGQLRLLRDRIDADWKTRLADLNTSLGTGPAAFRRAVDAGLVDALVFFDDSGSPEYPSLAVRRARDVVSGRDDWRTARSLEDVGNRTAAALAYAAIAARERDPSLAARAAQAHVRALVQAGDAALAILAIEKYFTSGRIAGGRDLHGRLIGADAQLLALRLLKQTDDRYTRATQRLAALLDDYDRTVMPSGQRLFLMDELRAVAPDVRMPTHAAERLAAEFLQSDGMRPEGSMLESARGSGVWKLRVHGSAVALFTTETVVAFSRRILDQQSGAIRCRFFRHTTRFWRRRRGHCRKPVVARLADLLLDPRCRADRGSVAHANGDIPVGRYARHRAARGGWTAPVAVVSPADAPHAS